MILGGNYKISSPAKRMRNEICKIILRPAISFTKLIILAKLLLVLLSCNYHRQ